MGGTRRRGNREEQGGIGEGDVLFHTNILRQLHQFALALLLQEVSRHRGRERGCDQGGCCAIAISGGNEIADVTRP